MPNALETYLEEGKMYHSLSVSDLLEARDAYHVFLTRKKNVIGTAIGKYRMRKKGVPSRAAKTLENSEVRNYSWPCVLVFVMDWIDDEKFGKPGTASYNDYIPKRLNLPNGREIPVCVIKAAWKKGAPGTIKQMKYPGSVIGGGYPVMTRVQGEERWATLGGLVSDGRVTYALTNAHVTGHTGELLFTLVNGNERQIGSSSEKQLKKAPFSEVYEGLSGKHSFVNLDIGLIELDDLHGVTSQVFGLGEIKGVADVSHDTLSLKLIGCPLLGYGCSSGVMKGEIAALFYRYASSGGYDYVADYIVGPRATKNSRQTAPFAPAKGDSGTLLVVDDPNSSENGKAIGVLWGGQKSEAGAVEQPYGLVTNLTTVCRLLGVEFVCAWNTGYDDYFGAYAHVVLPSLCADVVKNAKLKKLMANNASRFSMPLGETEVKQTKGLSKAAFVPLSDVPDLVWKRRGGPYQRGREGANHFADMDQPNPDDNDRTLLDLCATKSNIDPDVWIKYYEAVGAEEKGALPFRIAQIYDAMVKCAGKGDTAGFVCAAGILTHYVFDACMPLHISYMHHGDPKGPKIKANGGKEKPIAYNVHAEFDNEMVEYFISDLEKNLPSLVRENDRLDMPVAAKKIKTANDAAAAAVGMMQNTVKENANPIAIVRDYAGLVDNTKRDRCKILWKKYGPGYQQAMAEAVVLAARLWDAAWDNGGGAKKIKSTGPVDEDALKKLYETRKGFLDSVNLEDIKNAMSWV